MKARASRVVILALLLAPATAIAQDDAPHLPADSMEIGRKYADWLVNGEVDSLRAAMEPELNPARVAPETDPPAEDQ